MQVTFKIKYKQDVKVFRYVTDGLPFLLPVCKTTKVKSCNKARWKKDWMNAIVIIFKSPGPFERTIQKHSSCRVMTTLFFNECMKHISEMTELSTYSSLIISMDYLSKTLLALVQTVACYQCTKVCVQQRVAPPTKLMIMILFQWLQICKVEKL